MHRSDLRIRQIPAISAVYFGLLTSGYDYFHYERDDRHTAELNAFRESLMPHPFFTQARQSTCEAYAYWPRAALLETAVFHLTSNCDSWQSLDAFHRNVMQSDNIADHERDDAFFAWVEQFPSALQDVMNSPRFADYLHWEQGWISAQNRLHANSLHLIDDLLHRCRVQYDSPVRNIRLVLNPIKCVYSADYHLVNECFIFTSGRLQTQSVIHEFLHHVVHPLIVAHRQEILQHTRHFANLDDSYYAAGPDYAFEEFLVRHLTLLAAEGPLPDDLPHYVHRLLNENDL